MKGPYLFRLNWKMDNEFSQTVKLASESGVKILAYDSIVTKNSIEIGDQIEIDLKNK